MPSPLLIVGMLVTGVLIGLLSGLLGIGGGMQMIAIFKLCFRMTPIACTATSLFVVLFTSISGSVSHIRNHTCLPKLGLAMGLGGAVLSPIGVNVAAISPDWVIMCAAAAVVCYSAITMFRKALAMKPAKATASAGVAGSGARGVKASGRTPDASAGTATGSATPAAGAQATPAAGAQAAAAETEAPVLTRKNYVQAVFIGMVAGFASGYIGVGGGFIMVPMMMTLIRMPMKLTSGTSLVAVMILAVPGVITQIALGNVDWAVGIFVALGSVPGAVLGSKAVPYIPERTLRFAFGFLLIVVGVLLIVDQFGFLG